MIDQPRFHARNVETLTTSVQREIERMIMAGEVAAGDRLSESALADAMGVSRGPVREAMRALAQAGLVEIIANKGVVVRRIEMEEVLDLYDLRGVIFGLAVEGVACNGTAGQVAELKQNLADMISAYEAGDHGRYYELNVAFHAAIAEYSGNARARAIYESLVKEMHLFRRRGLSFVSNVEASLDEHRDIVEAIAAGDAEAAFRAGRAHVMNGKQRFLSTLQQSRAHKEVETGEPR
ncbi:FCD domain-containing protein [Kaustia mangrovi]|uniref:FCD domain-containing protein n=1 Tax=Kaustia mangrovi TaxID=2593653 RepID=A0A7S8C6C5_9HYPH|nr:GntR family transcriptional regulator [Kaustia mangrovi]QPC44207.1 FCD domain-containing protein [Kaustia mangrovi]